MFLEDCEVSGYKLIVIVILGFSTCDVIAIYIVMGDSCVDGCCSVDTVGAASCDGCGGG